MQILPLIYHIAEWALAIVLAVASLLWIFDYKRPTR